jgi:threonine aldolase
MPFLSDNTATTCPEILQAIVECNSGMASAYGSDGWSQRLDAVYSEWFEAPVTVVPVSTGTAANSLALAAMVPPWGAVVCPADAHIQCDECGAPEFFTGGAKLILAECDGALLTVAALEAALSPYHGAPYQVQPGAVSLSQATEWGRVYQPGDVAAVAAAARARGLKVHMDGARFANALVHLGCAPADVTLRAGVDILCLGATKNGAMTAEALVVFNPALLDGIGYRRKRAGHVLSKGRYIAAQLLAYVETGVWVRNAARANGLASQIAAAGQRFLMQPVEANEVFLALGPERVAALRAQGFQFYDWGADGAGACRLVVSWDQDAAEVGALARALEQL